MHAHCVFGHAQSLSLAIARVHCTCFYLNAHVKYWVRACAARKYLKSGFRTMQFMSLNSTLTKKKETYGPFSVKTGLNDNT